MDMVLVHQTASHGFDKMPWMRDGKELWEYIRGYSPILLTQVRESRFGENCREKLTWINRELGNVPVIFTPDSRGKGPFARKGDILIDDSEVHCAAWEQGGGVAIRHRYAKETARVLTPLLNA